MTGAQKFSNRCSNKKVDPCAEFSNRCPAKHPSAKQPTGKEPTGKQPTGKQPTGKEPTGKQPKGKQPTAKQPTKQPTTKQPTTKQPDFKWGPKAPNHNCGKKCMIDGNSALEDVVVPIIVIGIESIAPLYGIAVESAVAVTSVATTVGTVVDAVISDTTDAEPPPPPTFDCSPNSFAPGTKVLMADGGSKPIEDVKIGEQVVAADPSTGQVESRPVTALIVGQGSKQLVKLTIAIDSNHGDKTGMITATDNHPFWVPALHLWVRADQLRPGMWLKTSAGTYVQISAIKKWTAAQRVHNLTIDGLHTYHVLAGDQAVLVHNTTPGCGDPLRDYADKMRNNPRAKFASEYTSRSGVKYYGSNRHGQQADGPLSDAIKETNHHGGCAEIQCLIKAQKEEGPDAITGGTMRTLRSRNELSQRAELHGTPGQPCGRCQSLLERLHIDY
ncbi:MULTISPECIES: Hint domain-containing protein [unclassified Nonomuraea]|uniref:Hint domain-containing protein n=1 Tax=unclassified Nonomuraea TaxID=2593643 RepID=UPI0033F4AFC5